jgi:hypothetical protein
MKPGSKSIREGFSWRVKQSLFVDCKDEFSLS